MVQTSSTGTDKLKVWAAVDAPESGAETAPDVVPAGTPETGFLLKGEVGPFALLTDDIPRNTKAANPPQLKTTNRYATVHHLPFDMIAEPPFGPVPQ